MSNDTNILVSLHGNRIGLNKSGDLIIDGKVAVSNAGNPLNQVIFSDDFLGDALRSEYNFQEGSDTGATFAINAQKGGVGRLTTAANATVTMAVNGAQFDLGAMNYYAENGGLAFECRVKIDDITTIALFMGFTDQISALEMPWTISSTTFTSNADDSFGFLFDTAATTDTIRCVGTKATVDGTAVDTSQAWAAATWKKFRCESDASGNAKFYIDDLLVGSIASAVTATVALSPYIGGFSRAASARNIDVDTFYAKMDRA